MVWDFAESNPFATASGSCSDAALSWVAKALERAAGTGHAPSVVKRDAATRAPSTAR